MPHTYDYPRPAVTTDAVVFSCQEPRQVLLIRRGQEPFEGSWALPGGFIDMDEELEDACRRELSEETGINYLGELKEVGVFAGVNRDPRGRTIMVAYSLQLSPREVVLKAGDDAAEVGWFDVDKLPELAFDHSEVIQKALKHTGDDNGQN